LSVDLLHASCASLFLEVLVVFSLINLLVCVFGNKKAGLFPLLLLSIPRAPPRSLPLRR
jgi:hypothetical protein